MADPNPNPNPQPASFLNVLRQLWLSVRTNPVFVAFEGGATGAALDFIDDGITSHHLDFSHAGLHKLITVAIIGGMTAVRLLYRPTPGSNPKN